MIAGTERPDAAASLVAWLASPEVERILRASFSRNQPVAHPEILAEITIPEGERFDELDPWTHSIEEVAVTMDPAIDRAIEILFGDVVDANR